MLAKYSISVATNDKYMFFLDEQGNQVSVWDVLNLAAVAGCAVSVTKVSGKSEPVSYKTVCEDYRFTPVSAKLLIGIADEVE